MTAPDPVREALEAAGEAARVSLALDTTCPQAGGYVCAMPPCPCARDAAATAIITFLHAYAAGVDPRCIAGEWFPRFATAVERAAKEVPHA